MNKKVFVFDMDGTLLNAENQLLPSTIKILEKLKAQKHFLIIATGRPYQDAIRDLVPVLKNIDYLICNNGAYFVDLQNNTFTRRGTLSYDLVKKISKIVQNHNSIFAIHGNQEAKRTKLGDFEIDWNHHHFKDLKKFEDQIENLESVLEWAKDQEIAQMSLNDIDDIVDSLKVHFANLNDQIDLHFSSGSFLDINPKNTNKLLALQEVINLIGSTLNDVVAFGDSGNDLQMLEHCGLGFCMANGTAAAKIAANATIGSHNSDAISSKIEEIIGGV